MSTFVPSHYSNPATVRSVAGSVAKTAAWAAVAIPTLGIAPGVKAASDALKSKDKKYGEAIGKAEKFRRNYEKCCKRRKKKKKGCYPDKRGKGLVKTDCRAAYKDWKRWEKKAAKLADKLEAKLKKQGKLDTKTKQHLNLARNRPKLNAQEEARQVNQARMARGEPPINEAMYMEEAYAPEVLDTEPGISPMMIGAGVVGLGVVGAGLWFAFGR
jgi:hypothetical protein